MNCEYCHCIIGNNYRMSGVIPCHHCGTMIDTEGFIGTYEGKQGDWHFFRTHPSIECSGCENTLYKIRNPCGYSGWEEAVEELFGVHEFVGKLLR